MDRDGIEQWAAGVSAITDERPLMEFFRHQGGNMDDRDIATLLEPPQAGWDWVLDSDRSPELQQQIRRENRALRLYVEAKVEAEPAKAVAAARESRGTEFFLYGLGCATAQLDYLRSDARVPARQIASQLAHCSGVIGLGGP